ncbi:ferrichrome-iron receptor [Salmonella enterica subsp. enterica]|uniref:Ferrichrome-iron receptor n=1 Tax=Salmonella enterica I TaxID=59201 RepID=A0A3S4LML9_SALET|nr:ferrichrome-iron receptor [Salmonella enterica subsp. enterica]
MAIRQNSFKVGSYTVVDALVRYDLARVGMAGSNVALHVNNLFDREYVASCFQTYGCFWGAETSGRCNGNLPFLISFWARLAVPVFTSWLRCRKTTFIPIPPLRCEASPFVCRAARFYTLSR